MNSLIVDLRRHYQHLLIEREAIETNLLKLRELISLNEQYEEKNREDKITGEPQSKINTPQPTITPQENQTAPSPYHHPASDAYNEHWPWQRKILHVMTKMDRPATAREIAARIRELEPGSTQSIEKSVELTTSRMNIAGEISARKEGVKNFYFLKG